jgi:hypothetical protein
VRLGQQLVEHFALQRLCLEQPLRGALEQWTFASGIAAARSSAFEPPAKPPRFQE